MPRTLTVKVNWLHSNPQDKADLTDHVADGLQQYNTVFPSPPVAVADMHAAAITLRNAWNNRKNGPIAKTELENAETAVNEILHDTALYVNGISKGDKMIIEQANFEPTDPAGTPATIPSETSVKVEALQGGRLHLSAAKVPGATSYFYAITQDDVEPKFTINESAGKSALSPAVKTFVL